MLPSRKEFIGFTLLFAAFLSITFVNKSTFDSGDSIQHYLISKYSWQHPSLFFNHWGKPFFTLVSSPFSQFGFKGIQFFNILVAVLSGYIVYKALYKLGYTVGYFSLVVLFTATDYFLCMYSGLTEPLFGLLLVLSFYLVLEDKSLLAALVLSFLPFVRSEGNIILVLFAVYFISRKKYFQIFALTIGTVVFSVVGYPFHHKIMWVFTSNPYVTPIGNYGRGEWFYYVTQFSFVAGVFYSLFLVVGVVYFSSKFLRIKNWQNTHFNLEILFLVFGSFFGYFIAHSIFWWQGLFNSFGMTRVIIAILPIGLIICIGPIEALLKRWPKNYLLPVLSVVLIGFLFSGNKSELDIQKDFSLSPTHKLALTMNDWYKLNYQNTPIVIAAPHLAYIMNKDCFEPKQCESMSLLKTNIPTDKLIIWDNWMSKTEFGVTDKHLESLKVIHLVKVFSNGKDTLKIYTGIEK